MTGKDINRIIVVNRIAYFIVGFIVGAAIIGVWVSWGNT